MSAKKPVILWFRQDLRLADNPALRAAMELDAPVLPVYILDDDNAGDWRMGAASRWYLHESLTALNDDLDGKLHVTEGPADKVLPRLAEDARACAVYWNRCYEPWRIRRDRKLKKMLQDDGIKVRSFNGSLLWEPTDVCKDDGTPYRVFTPFYKNGCLQSGIEPRKPLPRPRNIELRRGPGRTRIDDLGLMPDKDWYESLAREWTPGERGARKRLREFLNDGIGHYADGRNRPDKPYVSRLSPHLHFGEMSPNEPWYAAQELLDAGDAPKKAVETFRSELGWREFSYTLLFHWPEITSDNLQKKFNRFPWRDDDEALRAWQRGRTGYPIIDAGMRELWQTGYMHNRVRMLVGSFLVKNLMLHWHHGERWFWDTLVDADLANNSASWQWVAGSGADAAPYFRIFNPVTQAKKFDPDGDYVRRYVPELGDLPTEHLHAPWEAPEKVLADAGIELGADYPHPLVDLQESRKRALDAFQSLTPGD